MYRGPTVAALDYSARNVDGVFNDFMGRRAGILKALTIDVSEFYMLCDPEKENLRLYGLPNGKWEVNSPVLSQEVPLFEIPEPPLGINFARDSMRERDWLIVLARHTDAWLVAVASYFACHSGLDKADRDRLYDKIADLPTLLEEVTGVAQKQRMEQSAASGHSSIEYKANLNVAIDEANKDITYEESHGSKDADENGGGSENDGDADDEISDDDGDFEM